MQPSEPSLRERLREMVDDLRDTVSPRQLIMGGVLLAVAGIAAYLLLRPGDPVRPEAVLPMATPLPAAAAPEPAPVLAHAAGAVRTPGVYELSDGSRIFDLVTAAGGLLADADADQVNLAAPLLDGSWVYFPRQGEAPPAAPVGGIGSGGSEGLPLNINAATATQLEELPGVGPATATAIVEHRDRVGGFTVADDLLAVPGIGPAKLEAIRDLLAF